MRLIDKDSIDAYLEHQAVKAYAEQEVESVTAAAKAVANEEAAA